MNKNESALLSGRAQKNTVSGFQQASYRSVYNLSKNKSSTQHYNPNCDAAYTTFLDSSHETKLSPVRKTMKV